MALKFWEMLLKANWNCVKTSSKQKLSCCLICATFFEMSNFCILTYYLTAEEYQKLAFPASEYVLNELLAAEEYELWAPIPWIVELSFNCGRTGWTTEAIGHLKDFSWRHSNLTEERYGSLECVITLHSLFHLHGSSTSWFHHLITTGVSNLRRHLKGEYLN